MLTEMFSKHFFGFIFTDVFRKFNLSKISCYTIYQLSVETATIHQLSFQEKPSLVHFTVLTYLLVLRTYIFPTSDCSQTCFCSPFKQRMAIHMRMRIYGCHIMVPETTQITNF